MNELKKINKVKEALLYSEPRLMIVWGEGGEAAIPAIHHRLLGCAV